MLTGRCARRARLADFGIGSSRLRPADLLGEAARAVQRHPGRALLTTLGTLLGSACFVAVLGLSSTLAAQVSATFDLRRATEVVVGPAIEDLDPAWHTETAVRRLRQLNGVVAAGRRLVLPEIALRRTASLAAPEATVGLLGLDADALRATGPRLLAGRLFDEFHDRTAAPVALLPRAVAERLGVPRPGVAVYLTDRPYTVIGIFDEVRRGTEALASAIVPVGVAESLATVTGGPARRDVLVGTAAGAAQLVGRQAPLALCPELPETLRAIAPPDPETLRRQVEGEVTRLSLLIGTVALVVGAVSIGGAASAGIATRAAEIGLRRALGARRRHVAAQLLAETTLLGIVGGVLGTLAGTLVTVGVSAANSWVPVLDLRVAVGATALAGLVGLLAGVVPAGRALRVTPVEALCR